MKRRNLVICRAGRTSLHPRWLGDSSSRNWDLIVSTYHDDTPQTGAEMFVHRFAGAKMPGLADLFARHWAVIEATIGSGCPTTISMPIRLQSIAC